MIWYKNNGKLYTVENPQEYLESAFGDFGGAFIQLADDTVGASTI